MQSQIFWYGNYNRNLIALLDRILAPGMLFIDIGANIGEISLAASNRVGEAGNVIAFEPVPDLADHLAANIALNGIRNIQLCRSALSDHSGEAVMFASESRYRDGTENDGQGTLYPADHQGEIRATVPLVTLDAFAKDNLTRVDVIKLDIEGGELAALRGANAILRKFGPALIVEVSKDSCRAAGHEMADVLNLLSDQGYVFFSIGRRGRLAPLTVDSLAASQNVYCVSSARAGGLAR